MSTIRATPSSYQEHSKPQSQEEGDRTSEMNSSCRDEEQEPGNTMSDNTTGNEEKGSADEEKTTVQSEEIAAQTGVSSSSTTAASFLTRSVERETQKARTHTTSVDCSPAAVLSSEKTTAPNNAAVEPSSSAMQHVDSVPKTSSADASLLVGARASAHMEHRRLSKDQKGGNIQVRGSIAASIAASTAPSNQQISSDRKSIHETPEQGDLRSSDKQQHGLHTQNLQEWNEKRGLPNVKVGSNVHSRESSSTMPIATAGINTENLKARANNTKQRVRLTHPPSLGPAQPVSSMAADASSPALPPTYIPEQISQQQPLEELAVAKPVYEEVSVSESQGDNKLPQQQQRASQKETDPNLAVAEARPVKVEDSALDLLSSTKGRCCVAAIIVIVVLIAGGIAYGLTGFESSSSDDDNSKESFINGSQIQDDSGASTVMALPTIAPTATPSSLRPGGTQSPTQYESIAPTSEFQDYIVSLLPNFTLSALEDDNSPQSRALEWLTETPPSNYTDSRLLQRYALATLYYATSGMQWRFSRNWVSLAHECDWWSHLELPGSPAGEVCNDEFEYTALLLHQNVLKGTLPPEISLLSKLQQLVLTADDFQLDEEAKKERLLSGTIPSQLSLLAELEVLDLSKNAFSGRIPSELGLLDSLRELKLLQNILSFSIPSELSQLDTLQELLLQDNRIEGQIPSELGLLSTNLYIFTAYKNMLEGSIPSELGQLRMLSTLNIQTNRLTSTIPSHLGMLPNVNILNLEENRLIGTLPTHLTQLVQATHFSVASNQLNGTLPLHFGNMTGLRSLGLQDNKLSGTIPTELAQLKDINTINLRNNDFTGVAPSEVCQLKEANPVLFNLVVDCQEVECNCRCCKCGCNGSMIGDLIPSSP